MAINNKQITAADRLAICDDKTPSADSADNLAAVRAAKEAAKEKSRNKISALKSKGATDAQNNNYDPPSAESGFSYDIMNYQEGWVSTGKSLPDGVERIRQPSVLGFRSGCRDLENMMSTINDQEVEDDTSTNQRTAPGRFGGVGLSGQNLSGLQLSGIGKSFIKDVIGPIDFIPKTSHYDGNTGNTITTEEPPIDPLENSSNVSDSELQRSFENNILQFKDSPFLGLGKTATIIDVNDYSLPIASIKQEYGIEKSLVKDHIKNFNGSFYVLDTNLNTKYYKETSQLKKDYLQIVNSITYGTLPTLNNFSNETYIFKFGSDLRVKKSEDASRFKTSFVFGLPFTGSINGQTKDIFKFEKLVDENQYLYDNIFSLQMPFENSELLNTLNLIGTSIVDIKQNYNFYIEEYEKIAIKSNSKSQENVFPNLYILNAILDEKTEEKEFLSSLAKLDGKIQSGKNFLLNKSQKIIFGIKDNIGEYFDLFGLNYDNLLKNSLNLHNSFKNKLNNVIFLSDTTKKLNEINKKKYMFPMSVEISLPTDKTTSVNKILMDSDLMDSFMMKLCDLYLNKKFSGRESVITDSIFEQVINPGSQQTEIRQTFNSKKKNVNIINISDLLEDIKQFPINLQKSNFTIIGDTTKYTRTNSSSMTFVNSLRNIIFNSKLNTFVRSNSRTYRDILNGKKCYNETLAFRISKYENGNNSPIQNYWIPNNPDLDLLSIVDTQVKYDKEYTYKIFAYQFVLGNRIKQTINNNGTSDYNIKIDVENLAQANLMEIEIFTTRRAVRDTPPLSPEILFVPYYGVDNKIGLFLNGRTGEEKLEVINILSTDDTITSLYEKNLNNTVLYKSDDVARRFEIMKLEKEPNSYQDFSKGFIKYVNTDIDPATIQSATAASFIDSIEPNKKYYYCFRAVDVHEKISNPTQIFEVEMINEKGMIFPIIKNYEFRKPTYSNTKEIRRLIKIMPASQHTLLNRQVSHIDNDTTAEQSLRKINLGLSDVSVPWGKTFKMVITSKQTGKKCEFKFKFNYKTE